MLLCGTVPCPGAVFHPFLVLQLLLLLRGGNALQAALLMDLAEVGAA